MNADKRRLEFEIMPDFIATNKGITRYGHGTSKKYKHSELTDRIIKAFYKVYNTLGFGFLEKVYENALAIELRNSGLGVKQQAKIDVNYFDNLVGEYISDLIVESKIIVEIKAVKDLASEHEAQLLNYLKATEIEVGLLLNFGITPQIFRRVFDNRRKKGNTSS